MKKHERFCKLFVQLGEELIVPNELFSTFEEYVCLLYGGYKTSNVPDLWYVMFCAKGAEIGSHQLPPSRASLHKHILHANYQAYIWRSCLSSMENIPLPEGFGWKVNQGELLIDWTDDKAAPDVVLGLMPCTCKKVCDQEKCSCAANGISCTDTCKCKTCANKIEETNSELIDFEEDFEDLSDAEE